VRSLLSDVKPIYSELAYLETEIQDIPKASPEIRDLIERGSYYHADPGNSLVVQRDGGRTIWIYPIVRKPEEWIKPGIDLKDEAAKKKFVEEDWEGWSEELKAIIVNADTEFTPRGFYALPVGHECRLQTRNTLLFLTIS
jgi:hypothetical protein